MDSKQPDLAGRPGVRAAAQFHRVAIECIGLSANLHHTNRVAVFVAEELQYVIAAGDVAVRRLGPAHAGILEDALVHQLLNVLQLLRRKRLAVEVERQLVRANKRTFL